MSTRTEVREYFVVSKATGAVIDAVHTSHPKDVLQHFENPHLLELRCEAELSERQLQDYHYWGERP